LLAAAEEHQEVLRVLVVVLAVAAVVPVD